MINNELNSRLKTTQLYKQALNYKIWCINNNLSITSADSLRAYLKAVKL